MKLTELAREYRNSAEALKNRITELERQTNQTQQDALATQARIHTLTAMWRDTRDVAVVCERYYERGYCRNERYKI